MPSSNSSTCDTFVTMFALLSASPAEVLGQEENAAICELIKKGAPLQKRLPDETIRHIVSIETANFDETYLRLLAAPGVIRMSEKYEKAVFG